MSNPTAQQIYEQQKYSKVGTYFLEVKKPTMDKFIITDPCYIMDDKQYDKICSEDNYDFEGQVFPLKSKHKKTGVEIVFHKIEGTPNGNGSYVFNLQDIGVDSGMLCIAETKNKNGWSEKFGATFKTLGSAKLYFPYIIKNF